MMMMMIMMMMIIIIIIIIFIAIPWRYSALGVENANHTCPQTEVKAHPNILGVTCGLIIESPSHFDVIYRNYGYKSVATQILLMLGWQRSDSPAANSSLIGDQTSATLLCKI